jgi:hypothetical protein
VRSHENKQKADQRDISGFEEDFNGKIAKGRFEPKAEPIALQCSDEH